MGKQHCEPCPTGQSTLFCGECGAVLDRAALKRVRIMGGVGQFSPNANVQQFLATGDPGVFDTPTP